MELNCQGLITTLKVKHNSESRFMSGSTLEDLFSLVLDLLLLLLWFDCKIRN